MQTKYLKYNHYLKKNQIKKIKKLEIRGINLNIN